jgi:hypothetical protein
MVGHNLNETLIQLIARKAAGGKATLIHKSITENGNYDPADEDPPVDGYDYVSVSVETYEDELAQALADLAAARGQIAELEEKIADYDECCDEAVTLIKFWFPDWPYDPTDPEPPTPQEIEEGINGAVETHEGYTFPSDTAYTDITAIVGGDTLEDVDAGFSLRPTYKVYQDPAGLFELAIVKTASDDTETWIHVYDWSGGFGYTSASNFLLTVTNPSTGRCHFECDIEGRQSRFTYDFTNTKLIGFGASGHEFKAKNI